MTRTAVVTGASSGIGAATARRLVKDGYEVVAAARREDRLAALAEEAGVRTARLDVTDADSVAEFAATVGELDVLVNNAGGAFGADPVASGSVDDWQAMFDVNVIGTLRVTQALLPVLSAGPGGSIVNITSTAAFINYEGGGGYSAAKHAEHALTETLRLELAGRPVRVIEIQPGMVKTDEFAVKRYGGDAAAAAKVYADVDRPLTAEDVAECIALTVGLPLHVNVDQLVLRPLAQAAQHKVFRGKLFPGEA
jgi:NADP-dependent 3-hydroxy acid dehydrogenase YdfG